MSQPRSSGVECPVCFGSGQITGPKSMAYSADPGDPFNAEVRLCDECEGTGVVTAVRRAGIEAASMDKVMAIVDRVLPEGAVAAQEAGRKLERELGL